MAIESHFLIHILSCSEVGIFTLPNLSRRMTGMTGRTFDVPGLGLEPKLAGPEPAVLPLDDPGI